MQKQRATDLRAFIIHMYEDDAVFFLFLFALVKILILNVTVINTCVWKDVALLADCLS